MKRKFLAIIFILSFFITQFSSSYAEIKPGLPKFYLNDTDIGTPFKIKDQQPYLSIDGIKKVGGVFSQINDFEIIIQTPQKELILDLSSSIARVYMQNRTAFQPDSYVVINYFKEGNNVWLNAKDLAPYMGYKYSRIKNVDLYRYTDGTQTITEEALYEIITAQPKVLPAAKPTDNKNYAPDKNAKAKSVKIVYLTFDDGPNEHTKEILALLKAYNQKATFFMLYNGIAKSPDLVKQMQKEGHELGLHGVTHRRALFYKDEMSPTKEMLSDQALLKKEIGFTTHLVRTPYGSKPYLSTAQYNNLIKAGFVLWDWNVDSGDSFKSYVSPKIIETRVITGLKAKSVPVVLMHDKACTVDALESILKWMKVNGYESHAITQDQAPVNWAK